MRPTGLTWRTALGIVALLALAVASFVVTRALRPAGRATGEPAPDAVSASASSAADPFAPSALPGSARPDRVPRFAPIEIGFLMTDDCSGTKYDDFLAEEYPGAVRSVMAGYPVIHDGREVATGHVNLMRARPGRERAPQSYVAGLIDPCVATQHNRELRCDVVERLSRPPGVRVFRCSDPYGEWYEGYGATDGYLAQIRVSPSGSLASFDSGVEVVEAAAASWISSLLVFVDGRLGSCFWCR